jgi:hypothetical protein
MLSRHLGAPRSAPHLRVPVVHDCAACARLRTNGPLRSHLGSFLSGLAAEETPATSWHLRRASPKNTSCRSALALNATVKPGERLSLSELAFDVDQWVRRSYKLLATCRVFDHHSRGRCAHSQDKSTTRFALSRREDRDPAATRSTCSADLQFRSLTEGLRRNEAPLFPYACPCLLSYLLFLQADCHRALHGRII